MARVWYRAVTVLLLRRRRPIGEPSGLASTSWSFVATLRGTAGAGRIFHALTELGVTITPMAQALIDPAVGHADLDAFDLDRRFDTVVLGSHLVNLPDADARGAFLRAARRHALDGGTVLVEHHPVDWAETAAATTPTPGGAPGMEEVLRDPPFVSAVSTYDIGGRYVRQPFTARVLSETELAAELEAAGLTLRRRLGPTWLEAVPPTIGA
jgi:hypothetical protein